MHGMAKKQFPEQVHRTGGNHLAAIDRTLDIAGYVAKAADLLRKAADDDNGSFERAGFLKQGYDYLDVIIRYANCAKDELLNA